MEMLKIGYYEVFGNTVHYEGGATGDDLDSMEEIPVDVIEDMGEYIGEEL